VVKQAAIVQSTGGHGSSCLRKRRLPGLNAALWDTWGIERDSYLKVQFKDVLQGKIPEDWDMKQDGKWILTNSTILKTAPLRRAHAVLFLLPYGSLDDREQMEFLHDHFEIFQNEIGVYVLLTCMDKLVPEIRSKINRMDELKEIQQKRSEAAAAIGIPLNRIYVSVPYLEEDQRNFEIDRLNYRILDLLLQSAVEYLTIGAGRQLKKTGIKGHTSPQNLLNVAKKLVKITEQKGDRRKEEKLKASILNENEEVTLPPESDSSEPSLKRSGKSSLLNKKCKSCKENIANAFIKHETNICHGYCDVCAEIFQSCKDPCPNCKKKIVAIIVK